MGACCEPAEMPCCGWAARFGCIQQRVVVAGHLARELLDASLCINFVFPRRQFDQGGPWMYKGASGDGGEGAAFRLMSGHNYSRGDEVFISYGTDCNDRFLLNYGFSLPDNTVPCRFLSPSGVPHPQPSSSSLPHLLQVDLFPLALLLGPHRTNESFLCVCGMSR